METGGIDEHIEEYVDGPTVGDIADAIEEIEGGDYDLMRDVTSGVINHSTIKKSELRVYQRDPAVPIDPELHVNDLTAVLHAEIDRKGVSGHHIKSFNTLCRIGIKQILTRVFSIRVDRMKNQRDETDEDRAVDYISFSVEFTDVNLEPPTTMKYKSGSPQMLTPNMARIKGLTYSGHLYVSFRVTATAHLKNGKTIVRTDSRDNFRIASVPIMVRSEVCNTHGCTREELKQLEEDPRNAGGQFIVKGGEWAVDNLENILNNGFHVYRNQHLNEVARGEFISKPGDGYENSIYVILRLLNNGGITFQITTSKDSRLEIPYYIVFRAFGMTRDRDILDHIVYGVDNDDPLTLQMLSVLERAFHVRDPVFDPIAKSVNSHEVISFIAQKMQETAGNNYKKDDNAVRFVTNSTYSRLDKYIFPHIGSDPSLRGRKLRFLGHLINKLLRVHIGVLESTDRDSIGNKRMHTAGVSLSKAFKTQANFVIIQETRKHLIKDFKSTTFNSVHLADSVTSSINQQDLERVLTQVITAGNKTITVKRNEVTNRVSSQSVYHKNDLNFISTMNTINATNSSSAKSKQNERADLQRRVHPTMLGYISITQSADTGEKVGMSKQMACSCSVAEASSSEDMKIRLYEDPNFIALDEVPNPADVSSRELTKVFVNGDWIGFCRDGTALAWYYRQARRYSDIHPYTTIVWEPLVREVKFWVDVGRLLRPLIIVYNNSEEFVEKFREWVKGGRKGERPVYRQWIKLTKEHVRGLLDRSIDIEYLRRERVIEYIAPEEQENAWLAPSLEVLVSHQNDIEYHYTHCDIELAIFGMVELSAPNINHSQAQRATMFTNQKKQTCGWCTLSQFYRIDKNAFFQYYCDVPPVKVFSDSHTCPNGQNLIAAFSIYTGWGQEDSAILNHGAVDRGLFNGAFYRFEKSELEKGESFGNPDYARTVDVKKDANYGYIENGFVREGVTVKKGDVLIVKSAKIQQPVDQYMFNDRSTVYKHPDDSYVEKVVVTRNDEDAQICKVKLRSERKIRVGDKLCMTPDHDVLTTEGWVPIAKVTTEHKIAVLEDGVLQYRAPLRTYSYPCDNETLYEVESADVSQRVTLNHRMYTSIDNAPYTLTPARDLIGVKCQYKSDAVNDLCDYEFGGKCPDAFLELVGYAIFHGAIRERRVVGKKRKQDTYLQIPNTPYSIELVKRGSSSYTVTTDGIHIYDCCYDRFPEWTWSLSQRQCRLMIRGVVGGIINAEFECEQLSRELMRLALHAGWSAKVFSSAYTERETVTFKCGETSMDGKVETLTSYTGDVYCVEVPKGVFYVRRNGKPSWTGNSSRNGNKSIIAGMWPAADMPYTEDGLIPDLILNPHGVPTRMVIGQLMEMTMGELAVNRGVFMAADAFRRIDMKAIIKELDARYGVKFGGHRRMYNGKTGNWFDTLIFIGPVGYQRLQKFVIDESYAVSTGPTSALTRQPLDGKINEGGLRLGEMEKDVYTGNSCMRALNEKMYAHSDGIDMPICGNCGRRAIINEKHGLYRCKFCKDDAKISLVPASWVSNVLYSELYAMGIDTRFVLEPESFTSAP